MTRLEAGDRRALLQRAQQQLRAGRPEEAEDSCRALLDQDGDNVFALSFLAHRALQRGDQAEALELSSRAAELKPDDPVLQQNAGIARQRAGRPEEALASFRRALQLKPGDPLLAFFAADALREAGREEAAARLFSFAFVREPRLREAYRDDEAGDLVRELSTGGNRLLRDRQFDTHRGLAAAVEQELGDTLPSRFHAFLRHLHGIERQPLIDPRQQPHYHFYPGLTARPWWDPADFSWTDRVCEARSMIAAEMRAAIQEEQRLQPYIDPATPVPDESWKPIHGTRQWSSLYLYKGGRRNADNCARCPETEALVTENCPLAWAPGHAPELFFSVLQPQTHIPPHYGLSNAKLVVHLPLELPPDCFLTVGGETRSWREDQCLVFDDSFLHEARNDSSSVRVVMIFEIWHPELAPVEQRAIAAVVEQTNRWFSDCGELDPLQSLERS